MANSFQKKRLSKRGQVTIFIIAAIVILAGVGLFFIVKGNIDGEISIPKDLEQVYVYYLECINQEASLGAMILGEHGGYIETPEFSAGSSYMPFSSQLDFLGNPVPYWYYISGNGVVKEQVPSKGDMEGQLNEFLEGRINDCDFSSFVNLGFEVELEREIVVSSKINDNSIDVSVDQDIKIKSGNSSWQGVRHSKKVDSSLGDFYKLSKKIYENIKETMFLEAYGIDILRLYAPVDGTEISCSPKIWGVGEIRENVTRALEANTGFIKVKGDYYDLNKEEHKYFVQEIGENVDVNVNFLYSREWPMKMEVWPNEGGLLVAEPVGLEEGMGMLGFCYVPYHFVYDLAYPVLVQTYYNDEMFQFPVVVYINKNKPRVPLDTAGVPNQVSELCEHKNTEMTVYTYDRNLNPVEAQIEFKCFDTTCNIGRTSLSGGDSILIKEFPQCVNGFIIARAEGYRSTKELVSSVSAGVISIFLDKEYELDLDILKDGSLVSGDDYAVVTFKNKNQSRTVSYPDQKTVKLTEGQYEIKTYIYSNTDLMLQGSSTPKCIDVPKSGLFGIFGATEEKCFNLDVPGQDVGFAISGGGTQNYYVSDSELEFTEKIVIDAEGFGVPTKIEDLQINYNNIENSRLDVRFE